MTFSTENLRHIVHLSIRVNLISFQARAHLLVEAVQAVRLVILVEREGDPVEGLHASGACEAFRMERFSDGTQDFARNWRGALLTLLESVLNVTEVISWSSVRTRKYHLLVVQSMRVRMDSLKEFGFWFLPWVSCISDPSARVTYHVVHLTEVFPVDIVERASG